MRRKGLRKERLALIRLYAGWRSYDVLLTWVEGVAERVRDMPNGTHDERIAKANAFMQAMREIPRSSVQPATPAHG